MRLRPIVMTTLAMIFGMLPVALALGEGGGFRAPMARAVIGGLITSTLLTLIVVPVVYTYLDDFEQWLRGMFRPYPSPRPPIAAKPARRVSTPSRRRPKTPKPQITCESSTKYH